MKVYDCFIFNDELSLLLLRLSFLHDAVDYFVIVESKRTLSGQPKPLVFIENKHLFANFLGKIIHVEAPVNSLPTWEYEYFQRNYIKEGLKNCCDDDLVHISDADEILNIKQLLPTLQLLTKPALVEVSMYYYWFNLKYKNKWAFNLVGQWKDINGLDIGERYNSFPQIIKQVIPNNNDYNGWHFSYLFGLDIKKYQKKIKDFSHQEYNDSYYLNENRILKCIILGVDLFEREFIKLSYSIKGLEPLLPYIKQQQLEGYFYKPSLKNYLQPENLIFLFKIKYFKRVAAYFINIGRKSKRMIKSILNFNQ